MTDVEAMRSILERLLPYLDRVDHIHLDFKRDDGDILFASEVRSALLGIPKNMNKTIELTEEEYTSLWYFLGIASAALFDRHPQTQKEMRGLIETLNRQRTDVKKPSQGNVMTGSVEASEI